MKHLWSIICRQTLINGETNVISLIDILEEITLSNPDGLPDGKTKYVVPLDFELVSYWMREGEEESIKLHIELVDSEKNIVSASDNKILIDQPDKKRVRTRIKGNKFSFIGLGQYLFKISIKENDKITEVAEIPVDVVFKPMIVNKVTGVGFKA
jgi:hypothetical protein